MTLYIAIALKKAESQREASVPRWQAWPGSSAPAPGKEIAPVIFRDVDHEVALRPDPIMAFQLRDKTVDLEQTQ
ncbi:MAG: hypothetical protein A3I01_10420 [Betaproteobacteria bacterium RIFCSPLOWO2_02_FULL_65_24]|nr:MAG: hypothetical protein A3I01_10420 [Betaproteobacteria bacterium RIFCSPLOWO2_02_FULL_65_24]